MFQYGFTHRQETSPPSVSVCRSPCLSKVLSISDLVRFVTEFM
jgi:hypothetical protein